MRFYVALSSLSFFSRCGSNPAQSKVTKISISSGKMVSQYVGVSLRGVTLNISVKALRDPSVLQG